MSSSDPNSKIDILDSAENVTNKLKKAVCTPKVCEENGVIAFVEYVLFPVAQLAGHGTFTIEKDGKDTVYKNISDLKKDYAADTVCIKYFIPSSHPHFTGFDIHARLLFIPPSLFYVKLPCNLDWALCLLFLSQG